MAGETICRCGHRWRPGPAMLGDVPRCPKCLRPVASAPAMGMARAGAARPRRQGADDDQLAATMMMGTEDLAPEIIRVRCTCGKVVKGPRSWGGMVGNCPHCRRRIKMPLPREEDLMAQGDPQDLDLSRLYASETDGEAEMSAVAAPAPPTTNGASAPRSRAPAGGATTGVAPAQAGRPIATALTPATRAKLLPPPPEIEAAAHVRMLRKMRSRLRSSFSPVVIGVVALVCVVFLTYQVLLAVL